MTNAASLPLNVNSELQKEIEDFENWLKNEDIPKTNHNGKISFEDSKMNFLLASNLIIALAQKGRTRTKIFKYLKERQKISGTYQTFCNHLKRSGIDQYFIDPLEKIKKSLPNLSHEEPSPTIHQKMDEKPTEKKPEAEVKTPSTPKAAEKASHAPKKFNHNPTPQKENLPPKSSENPTPSKRQWVRG